MKYEVIVSLKPDVLDPQARTISETFTRLGFEQIASVDVRRSFVLEVDAAPAEAEDLVNKLGREILSNPVAEDFTVRKYQ